MTIRHEDPHLAHNACLMVEWLCAMGWPLRDPRSLRWYMRSSVMGYTVFS